MKTHYRRQRAYWDSLASLDPDVAVIDPQDRAGYKNDYLSRMRDSALHTALEARVPLGSTVLDFGCGTGSASIGLLQRGYRVIGLDISPALLRHAKRRAADREGLFVAIDGRSIPLRERTVEATVIYGVLCYVTDDAEAVTLLARIHESMKPGAPLLMIEQARRVRTELEGGLKVQRTPAQWRSLLQEAGFVIDAHWLMRHGRFPTTPMIRYGMIPARLWKSIAEVERRVSAATGIWPWDYADVFHEATA